MIGVYKTTTSQKTQPPYNTIIPDAQYELDMCKKLGFCYNISWTKKVVREMFLDNVHFKEPIYKRLNMQLLHFLQEIAAGRGQYLSKED